MGTVFWKRSRELVCSGSWAFFFSHSVPFLSSCGLGWRKGLDSDQLIVVQLITLLNVVFSLLGVDGLFCGVCHFQSYLYLIWLLLWCVRGRRLAWWPPILPSSSDLTNIILDERSSALTLRLGTRQGCLLLLLLFNIILVLASAKGKKKRKERIIKHPHWTGGGTTLYLHMMHMICIW